jgi:hypothetical protein
MARPIPCPHELANDRIAERLGVSLDGRAEVAQARPGNRGPDRPLEARLRGRDQGAGGRADDSHRDRARGVGAVAVLVAGEVDPDHVPLPQHLPPIRDAMDDHGVHRGAEHGGIGRRPARRVPEERRARPRALELPLRDRVQLGGGHPGHARRLDRVEHGPHDEPGRAHLGQLPLALEDDSHVASLPPDSEEGRDSIVPALSQDHRVPND